MTKPNYGIDAPTVVRNMFALGGAMLLAGPVLKYFGFAPLFICTLVFSAFPFLLTASVMLYGSLKLKLSLRDRVVRSLNLRGHEHILDVGCGHGLMLIGAAKQLTTGKAIGIDIWQKVDQAGKVPLLIIEH